ncbi:hypothetical protein Pmani_024682 [Petrolisthes manimaculis]|uniref:Uncharacterized protein n=1 Tax=Petrolisthes manimaculis TaxID=1843537 RepID=A0AAE1P7P0_9EUCA|nr:hypothetical protein Pmani_024682 [Petrolisthes manimaculis]
MGLVRKGHLLLRARSVASVYPGRRDKGGVSVEGRRGGVRVEGRGGGVRAEERRANVGSRKEPRRLASLYSVFSRPSVHPRADRKLAAWLATPPLTDTHLHTPRRGVKGCGAKGVAGVEREARSREGKESKNKGHEIRRKVWTDGEMGREEGSKKG